LAFALNEVHRQLAFAFGGNKSAGSDGESVVQKVEGLL
jgi:hypothetical protein